MEDNMRSTVEKWRGYAKKTIREKWTKRQIAFGELFHSIAIQIISDGSSNGVSRIQWSFYAYGRFVDMGVGKGHPLGSRRENALRKVAGENVGKPRKTKPFYVRDIFNQGHVLHEILVEKYGIKMFAILEGNLDGGKIETTI